MSINFFPKPFSIFFEISKTTSTALNFWKIRLLKIIFQKIYSSKLNHVSWDNVECFLKL